MTRAAAGARACRASTQPSGSAVEITISALRRDALKALVITGAVVLGFGGVLVSLGEFDIRLPGIAMSGWVVLSLFVLRSLRDHPHARFGLANVITTWRAAIALMIAGLLPQAALLTLPDGAVLQWILAIVVLIALVADGVDGHVARSSGLGSAFGARYDMEIDALLALVLSLLLWRAETAGSWILGLGTMRYAFLLAMHVEPRLRAPLYPSFRRKLVCVIQIGTLCAMLVPVLPQALKSAAGGTALVLLAVSFLRDAHWLLNRRDHVRGDRRARFASAVGLLRSLAIYHGMPWRNRALHRFYATLIDDGALAFDIGAHVGNRTRALRALGARCVALEPQPLFATWLRKLFRDDDAVTLVQSAVGRAAGSATLRIASLHPTVSTLSGDWIETVGKSEGFERVSWDRSVEVPVTTLDALIERHGLPDFCKIDVEGMEPEILAGLGQAIPLLAVEYLPAAPGLTNTCIDLLCALGDYVFNFSEGESHHLALGRWQEADAIRGLLAQRAANGRSGDLYARLRSPSASTRLLGIPIVERGVGSGIGTGAGTGADSSSAGTRLRVEAACEQHEAARQAAGE